MKPETITLSKAELDAIDAILLKEEENNDQSILHSGEWLDAGHLHESLVTARYYALSPDERADVIPGHTRDACQGKCVYHERH